MLRYNQEASFLKEVQKCQFIRIVVKVAACNLIIIKNLQMPRCPIALNVTKNRSKK